MTYRFAGDEDLELLAHWNAQLITDEGHWNTMTKEQLERRMKGWLVNDHGIVIFSIDDEDVAYALYRETADEIFLRQFFVRRDRRRAGLGRTAVELLKNTVWTRGVRYTVSALVDNPAAVEFWRALGFTDFALTLTIVPK